MRTTLMTLAMLVASVSVAAGADPQVEAGFKAMYRPLPKQFDSDTNPITPEKVALGRMLYFETRLSKNHDVSCNTCHLLDKYGVDGEATSTGHKKQKGGRNAPTVYNAGGHIAQFWDGRAPTLEEQAKGPILNPIEMAHPDAATVEKLLRSIPGYAEPFKKAFPADKEPITYDNVGKAIGAFERTLVTPAPIDRFLAGDDKALSAEQREGLAVFMNTGCISCHMGPAFGGTMYQKLGMVTPVPGLKDEGRFQATKQPQDKFFFRVPSLRNIEKTGPYLHDGSIKTLEEMVLFMAKYQLGKELKPDETKKLVAFLGSLTGELPKDVKAPKLPPSGKDTPKPDPR